MRRRRRELRQHPGRRELYQRERARSQVALWASKTCHGGHLPLYVSLRMTKGGQDFCGGVLIASQFVLTAARCVTDGLVQYVFTMCDEQIRVLTDRVRVHPSYGKL